MDCNLKPTKLPDCALIGVCAVIRLNTVYRVNIVLRLSKGIMFADSVHSVPIIC